ncbi:MAG: hypothetical protein COC23_07980 [Hyphomicrobiales bacterium]|nr:MAG: hypothetical protein COC23_07980 [Hyphomicrobiales bacterium]
MEPNSRARTIIVLTGQDVGSTFNTWVPNTRTDTRATTRAPGAFPEIPGTIPEKNTGNNSRKEYREQFPKKLNAGTQIGCAFLQRTDNRSKQIKRANGL